MNPTQTDVDVAIVGGGPAGLSAALILGRALKRVRIFDAGPRRNAAAVHLHGFVTRDGTPPPDFRRIGREQLGPYDVSFQSTQVVSVTAIERGERFRLVAEDGSEVRALRVILALGVVDELPALTGLREAWGRGVFQCPHCHGFEHRGKRWGLWLTSNELADFALMLTGWTRDLIAFADGGLPIKPETSEKLAAAGVRVETSAIERLVVEPSGMLEAVELHGGNRVPLDVLFMKPKQRLPELIGTLGVSVDDSGFVQTSARGETSIPGMYAAGDVTSPLQVALAASYQGAMAAWTIVHELNVSGRPRSS